MGSCKNLVLMCMDYRFQSVTHDWLRHRGFEGQFDVISIPGSSLGLLEDTEKRTYILNQLAFACRAHEIRKLIIFHHEDCAALPDCPADTMEQAKLHHQKMDQAESLVLSNFPNLEIEKYFISHKGVFFPEAP